MKLRLSHRFASLIFITVIGYTSNTIAESIHGSITFIKKPPLVGIAYIPFENENVPIVEIDQLDKQFTSKMAVIKSGEYITFKNSDIVEHNVYANDFKQSAKFDVGLMPPNGEKKVLIDWKEDIIVRVGCKIHPKMRTYLASIDTPYHKIIEFQKGAKEYTFTINNIPKYSQTLFFNIPKYDVVVLDLTVGTSWAMDITKKGKIRGHIKINKK